MGEKGTQVTRNAGSRPLGACEFKYQFTRERIKRARIHGPPERRPQQKNKKKKKKNSFTRLESLEVQRTHNSGSYAKVLQIKEGKRDEATYRAALLYLAKEGQPPDAGGGRLARLKAGTRVSTVASSSSHRPETSESPRRESAGAQIGAPSSWHRRVPLPRKRSRRDSRGREAGKTRGSPKGSGGSKRVIAGKRGKRSRFTERTLVKRFIREEKKRSTISDVTHKGKTKPAGTAR